MTKHTDIDQYKYSEYGIGFSRNDEFSFGYAYGKNLIIFGVDASNSKHTINKTQSILILGNNFTDGLAGTTISVEKFYSINFAEKNKKFCLSLDYNGDNSYLFLNGTKIIKFIRF